MKEPPTEAALLLVALFEKATQIGLDISSDSSNV